MQYGSTMDDDVVSQTQGEGRFFEYMKSLDLGEMVRYDHVPDFQSALYAPKSLLAEDRANSKH